MSNSRVCHYKLVLLGDSSVGKSCLVVRFVRDEFFDSQEPTIGGNSISIDVTIFSFLTTILEIMLAAFLTQSVALDDTTVKFEIWDTAGQGSKNYNYILL